MTGFRWRHFCGEVILWAVRYRDLEEMLHKRGVEVDHTTLYRWVQRYAPDQRDAPKSRTSSRRPGLLG